MESLKKIGDKIWDNLIPISVLFWFITKVIYMLYAKGIPQPEGLTEELKFAIAEWNCFYYVSSYLVQAVVFLVLLLYVNRYTDRLFSFMGMILSLGFLVYHGFLINTDLHTQIDIINSEMGSLYFSIGIFILSAISGFCLIRKMRK